MKGHPIKRLVTVAEEVFSLPRGQLLLHERGAYDSIAQRRQLVYLVAHEAGFSYHSIGRRMGRNHSSVKHGVYTARRRLVEPVWAERKSALEEEWAYANG